jgi:hypothetical protein
MCGVSINHLQAQKFTFEDVTEIKLKDLGPIFQGHTVKGYFAFYYLGDSDKKKMANYKLLLLDENLNKIADKKLVEPKDINLQTVAYDGNELLVIFHNEITRELEFRHYDLKLNELSKKIRDLEHTENLLISEPYMSKQKIAPHVFTVDGKGFLFYDYTGMGGTNFITEFIPDNGKNGWKREKDRNDTYGLLPNPLCYTDKLLLHNFLDWNTPSTVLQATNLETGKDAFYKEMTIDNYIVQVMHAYPDSAGNFVVVGQYYNKKDNILKVSSIGIFMGKINPAGNFIEHKYLLWAKDIAAKVKIAEDGKIDGRGYIFFQNAVHTKDGRLYLCGELFSLAGYALARGVRVQDFLIMEINPDMTLNEVKIIDKKEKVIEFGGIPLSGNPMKLANAMRMQGHFDYQLTQIGDNDDAFTFFYRNDEMKGRKTIAKRLSAVSKHVGDNTFESDIITFDSKSDIHRTLPAKPGHLLLIDYYSDKKKLDMRIEKFNY